jgi:outer membrane murein-binding lipoprotein Lpp
MHRPAMRGSRLCARHQQRWKKARRKAGSPGFEKWLAAQVPYDSFGGCRVAVCPELAYSPLGLCHGHESAYRLQGSPGGARLPDVWFGRFEQADQPVPVCYDNEAGFGRWCRAALPLPRPGTVNLRGLAPLQRLTAENTTLKQRLRQLTSDQRAMEEKLQAARSNNRFLDKRIASLEAQLLDAGLSGRT